MTLASRGTFIVGAKRTPFCKYGGSIKELAASRVFAAAAKDAIHSANLNAVVVDSTVIGNVHYLSQCDGGKTPRYCGLFSGLPIDRPALGVTKGYGSGLQAIINGSLDILTGSSNMCLTGGTEVMSSLPHFVRNIRFGKPLGSAHKMEDPLGCPNLNKLAEYIIKKFGLSQEECDQYTMNSHSKWQKAQKSGGFDEEITELTVDKNKNKIRIQNDEVTLANTTSIAQPADGAAAIILANEESLHSFHLKPLARVVGWVCVGCNDDDLGLETAIAVRRLLDILKLTIGQVDIFEINETTASQVIVTTKELNLDISIVNVSGGALSMGDPVAATGVRMATHIVHQFRRQNGRRAIAASSCGDGQAIAIMFERT